MEIVVRRGRIEDAEDEAIVVNLFEGVAKPGAATAAVDVGCGGIIARILAAGDFKGKKNEVAVLYPHVAAAKRIILVGLGKKETFDVDVIRQVSATVAKRAGALRMPAYTTIAHGAGAGRIQPEAAAQAVAEGTILGSYKFEKYKSKSDKDDEKPVELSRVTIVAPDASSAAKFKRGIAVGVAIGESVNFTRDVANESGNEGTAVEIARRVERMAKEAKLRCRILEKGDLRKLGMNAILAVNQGSANEPRMVILEHNPKAKKTVCLVGKGITFDSGGISIKPGEAMDKMKHDKSGAAAVFGALRACALLKVPIHVVGIAPLTDNLPSGSAYKPGDVIRTYNGKTIEVLNTDAEGRVLLSDALAYAEKEFKPEAIVDLATLTGACGVALGSLAIAGMGTDEQLLNRIRKAGDAVHERVWPLPFWDEYDVQIKSDVADVKNLGGRMAGTITGGRFLRKFVNETPWVHLDIASTAWDEGGAKFNPEYSPGNGATGVGVRLMVEMLRKW